MVNAPIWKDTYYTSTANSVTYRIELEGEVIFSGKAYKFPGADNVRININKICSNYLTSDIEPILNGTTGSVTNYDSQRTFNLYVGNTNVEDYRFYLDWSYDGEKAVTGTDIIVSNPVNGHYTAGMYTPKTTRTTTASSSYSTVSSSSLYDVSVGCGEYAVYYLNSYGGWDAFLFEGKVTRKDDFTSYQTDKVYDNTTLEFELNKYVNEVKTTLSMNTGYLNDQESENLAKNLIGSIKVYVHNLKDGWIKPAIITDNSVTYLTFKGNNRKPVNYQINVMLSQTTLRK